MLRKYISILAIFTLMSCGKDVVIIEDPQTPIESENLYEVNLIGFITDNERVYLPNGRVILDKKEFQSDASGIFHFENILIGERGSVIRAEKDGYLPLVYRVANHQSLEDVILNLEMIPSPESVSIGTMGGSIESDFSTLIIPEGVLSQPEDVIFKSLSGKQSNNGNADPLYFSQTTEYILKEASFYLERLGNEATTSELEVQIDRDQLSSSEISEMSAFYYDLETLSWKKKDYVLSEKGNVVSFSVDQDGWWTIGRSVATQYGSLTLSQDGGVAVSKAETQLTIGEDSKNSIVYYTSSSGTISNYFPIEEQIVVSMDDGMFVSELPGGFSPGTISESLQFNEDVQTSFQGQVYTCDFSPADGFVAIISDSQHKITRIQNGNFADQIFTENDNLKLKFYTEDYEFLSDRAVSVEALESGFGNFYSCSDLNDKLTVLNGVNLLESFDMCRVKVRPKETVVIGERDNGDVFLASFEGEKEGTYDGLIYFPLITDADVSSDVQINIVFFDKEAMKIGGFIKTEYINTGQELTISFIGDIE